MHSSLYEQSMNKLPPNFLLSPHCYVDTRITSLPGVFNQLRGLITPHTVYNFHSLNDLGFDWGAWLIHPAGGDTNHDLVFTVPLAFVKPKILNKTNNWQYLAVSHFCPWCNLNYLEVIHKGLVCDKNKHTFVIKSHNRKITTHLQLKGGCLEILADITNLGHKVDVILNGKAQPSLIVPNYIDVYDKYRKLLPIF